MTRLAVAVALAEAVATAGCSSSTKPTVNAAVMSTAATTATTVSDRNALAAWAQANKAAILAIELDLDEIKIETLLFGIQAPGRELSLQGSSLRA